MGAKQRLHQARRPVDHESVRAQVIAFTGASGGAGVSCLVAATAMYLSGQGAQVACIDRDPLGGGLDVVFGLDHVRAVRWPALLAARGEVDAQALLKELPQVDGVWILSHGRDELVSVPPEAEAAILAGLCGGVDVVLIDAGRPTLQCVDDIEMGDDSAIPAVGSLAGADDVVLVVDATPQSMAAAGPIVANFAGGYAHWWLAQRVPRGLNHLPEAVAAALGLPIATDIKTDSRCATALLDGIPPGRRGPLAKAAEHLALRLGQVGRQAA